MRFVPAVSLSLMLLAAPALRADGLPDTWYRALDMERLDDPAPPLVLADGRGDEVVSAGWRDKVVFVHFWATWCGPCRTELPEFERFAARLDPARAIAVLVSIDDTADTAVATRFLAEIGVSMPSFIAHLSHVPAAFWSRGVPVTYVIDGPTGEIGRCLGPRQWTTMVLPGMGPPT